MADTTKLRALCDAATKGPWTFEPWEGDPDRVDGIESPGGVHDIVRTDSGFYPPCRADAEFICAARDALPELLEENERLRKELQHNTQKQTVLRKGDAAEFVRSLSAEQVEDAVSFALSQGWS